MLIKFSGTSKLSKEEHTYASQTSLRNGVTEVSRTLKIKEEIEGKTFTWFIIKYELVNICIYNERISKPMLHSLIGLRPTLGYLLCLFF